MLIKWFDESKNEWVTERTRSVKFNSFCGNTITFESYETGIYHTVDCNNVEFIAEI